MVGGRLVGGSEDETASPQTQPTEVIEVAASEVAPPTSVAGARPEPTTAPVPESEPVSAVVIRDSSLEAQLPGVNTPAAGQSYHAWLLGGESVEPLHLNRDGTVDLLGNELIISFAHPDGVNLLSQYEQFVVSLEEEGSLLTQPSAAVFAADFDPNAVQLVRLADQEKGGDAVLQNLRTWLPRQAAHFVTHSGFALDGVQREDLPYVKTHSEHTLNIVEGRTGELYQDWDGDGSAQNPGDDVGVVPYLALLRPASVGGSRAEILRGGSGQAGNDIANRADEIGDLIADIRETVRQILLVDTIGDVSAFGLDSDLAIQRDVKALIDQLVADSLAVDLAFAFDVFAHE